jgi:hypothetical protein
MELYDISIGARVKHPTMGVGVVYDMDQRTVHVFFKEHGEQPISRSFEGLVTIAPGVEIGQEPLDLDHVRIPSARCWRRCKPAASRGDGPQVTKVACSRCDPRTHR